MKDFEFYNPCRVLFGKSSESKLLYEIRGNATSVLLVYGGGSIKRSNLYDLVTDQLREAGVRWQEIGGISPNPLIESVRRGVKICRDYGVDLVLAVGGGSVIDAAKAIAVGAVEAEDVWQFFCGKPVRKALPIGVITTIAASGSECSSACVITGEQGLKRRLRSNCVIPRFAIINPERATTLPRSETAGGVCDIISHFFERYLTKDGDEFVDGQLIVGMKTVMKYGEIASRYLHDYDARAELAWCAAVAHNNSLSVGRVTDWGSHDVEFELSSFNDLPHGEGMAIVFPAWIELFGYKLSERLVVLGKSLFGLEYNENDDLNIYAKSLATAFREYFKRIGLRTTLSEVGIEKGDIKGLCDKAFCDRSALGAVYPLSKEDMEKLLLVAL